MGNSEFQRAYLENNPCPQQKKQNQKQGNSVLLLSIHNFYKIFLYLKIDFHITTF